MFSYCSSLSNINSLQNWNVSNGKDFSFMFAYCSSIPTFQPIKNWKGSNATNYSGMIRNCPGFSDSKVMQQLVSNLK